MNDPLAFGMCGDAKITVVGLCHKLPHWAANSQDSSWQKKTNMSTNSNVIIFYVQIFVRANENGCKTSVKKPRDTHIHTHTSLKPRSRLQDNILTGITTEMRLNPSDSLHSSVVNFVNTVMYFHNP